MLLLKNICKNYDGHVILDKLSLDVEEHGITCLMGISGCGKSTVLRIILGLENIDAGECFASPEDCAMVFQDPRLLPWLNIQENLRLALPPRCPDALERIAETLRSVQLTSAVCKKMPRELSGGMAQRVAVARALLNSPKILLMGEPFAALDALTRERLQDMLLALSVDLPCLFVTHDIHEAMRIGKKICLMGNGAISECFPQSAFSGPEGKEILHAKILSSLVRDRSEAERPAFLMP